MKNKIDGLTRTDIKTKASSNSLTQRVIVLKVAMFASFNYTFNISIFFTFLTIATFKFANGLNFKPDFSKYISVII